MIEPGHLQKLVDRARLEASLCDYNTEKTLRTLIEIVVFLATAQKQTMEQFDEAQRSRTDIVIGCQ
jgi:hypothetical protein